MKTICSALVFFFLGSLFSVVRAAPILPQIIDPNLFKDESSSGEQLNRTREMIERNRVAQQIEEDISREDSKIKNQTGEKVDNTAQQISFDLVDVDYNKSSVLNDEDVKVIISKYVGHTVYGSDLYKMLDEINDLYAKGGFITCKAFLPPQKIESGIVKIFLVEGKTGKVSINGQKNTKNGYIMRRIKLPSGEILNINELNERIMFFNATNDVQLRVAMQAGEEAGTTDYVLDVYEPQRFSNTLFVDNSGNYTSGEYRTGYFFTAKSLSGVRDNLTLGTVVSKGTKSYSISYSVPVSPSGTQVGLSVSGNKVSIVDGQLKDAGLNVEGDSIAYAFNFRQPWIVNATTRSEVGFDINNQSSQTTIEGQQWVDDKTRDFIPYFSHTGYGKSHVFYQRISYCALGNFDSFAEGYKPRGYHYVKYNSFYQKSYVNGNTISVRFDAQLDRTDSLPSSRQFYIGGSNSVRGYKESYLSGDRGFSTSLEYSIPLHKNRKHNAFFFYDYGYTGGTTAFRDHILQSVGFGIKSNWNKSIYSSICLAAPLKKEVNVDEIGKTKVHFIVSGTF